MESRMREIRTYGLMRGKSHRRQSRGVGLYSTKDFDNRKKETTTPEGVAVRAGS